MYRTAAVLAALGVAIAGCTANGDGSTSCQDFNSMSRDEQGATVARMLKESNARNSSTSDVMTRVATTVEFCAKDANRDKTVGDAT